MIFLIKKINLVKLWRYEIRTLFYKELLSQLNYFQLDTSFTSRDIKPLKKIQTIFKNKNIVQFKNYWRKQC